MSRTEVKDIFSVTSCRLVGYDDCAALLGMRLLFMVIFFECLPTWTVKNEIVHSTISQSNVETHWQLLAALETRAMPTANDPLRRIWPRLVDYYVNRVVT